VIPNTFSGPKVIFTGMEDPEAHLFAFHTQMVLVGGSDAAKCKLFMSTLTGMAMDWFISLPNGHITSFRQLSRLFREQYLANRAPPPPVSYDLFDVKQYQGETLKEGIHQPLRGPSGKGWYHRRAYDVRIQERRMPWPFSGPEDFCLNKASGSGGHRL